MRGVYRHVNGSWCASYQNIKSGISKINRYFKTKSEAEIQRKKWEKIFGMPDLIHKKNFSGFENDKYIVLGDTGESVRNAQSVLALNKRTKKLEKRPIQDIKNGKATGFNERTSQIKNEVHGTYKKGKYWQSKITIQNKAYSLGSYPSRKRATEIYDKALNEWLSEGKLPSAKFLKPQNDNFIGEKYIHYAKNRNKPYVFEKISQGKRICKYFLTLQDAIEYKNEYLNKN